MSGPSASDAPPPGDDGTEGSAPDGPREAEDRPTGPGSELDAWFAARAVTVAHLADSPAASEAAARLDAGTLSPAASRAIARASTQPTRTAAPPRPSSPDDGPEREDEAASTDAALEVLGRAVSGVRVVGLAHALPGTHELATLAQRIVENLVEEHGVTTLAVDASATATIPLDRHVRTGDSTTLEVLDGLGSLTWRTREAAALVEALRTHNRERSPEQQVRIVGLDPRRAAHSVLVVGGVLRDAAPEVVEELSAGLAGLVGAGDPDERTVAGVEAVARGLDDQAVVAATDPELLAEARRHVPLLRRAAEYATAGADAPAVRERLMAQAVLEVLDGTDGDAGPTVALWGHADHLLVGDDPVPTLGRLLRTALGDGYYVLGMLAGGGACRAVRRRRVRGPSRSLTLHRFSPAPDLAADLAAATRGDHVVDLRSGRADVPAEVTRWWDEPRAARILGEEIAGRANKIPLRRVVPGQAADGWATVAQVRPATPQ